MSNSFDPEKITPETAAILKKNGIDPSVLQNKSAESLLSSLSKTESEKINALLNDKKALEQILSGNKAKAIINQLFGGAK